MSLRKQPSRASVSNAPWLNPISLDLTAQESGSASSLSASYDSSGDEANPTHQRPKRISKPVIRYIDEDDYLPSFTITVQNQPRQQPKQKTVQQQQQQQQPKEQQQRVLKEAPYRSVRNVDAIHAHLSLRVKDQPALYHIAAALSAVINTIVSEENPVTKPFNFTFAGVSGCGKTETFLAIKSFLGMDDGYEAEGAYIFLDGSVLVNESTVNAITGAAPGLVGYRDGSSIADRLNKAIGLPTAAEVIASMEKSKKQQQRSTNALSLLPAQKEVPVAPRFILLVIDELDKVSIDFLMAINGLIETGNYDTPDGISFKKPQETSLIIIFTCNYGENELVAMEMRDDDAAERFILNDMRLRGLPACTLGRLGNIFPYYPLTPFALNSLLGTRLDEHIQRSTLANKFGKNRHILFSGEAKMILVSNVLSKVCRDLGVRAALKQMLRKVDLLFEKAFSVLTEMVNEGIRLSKEDELEVSAYHFNIAEFEDSIEYTLPSIIHSIKNNPVNEQILALCRSKHDDTLNLDAMGIRLGKKELCHLLVPMRNNNNNIVIDNDSHHHLKEDNDDNTPELRELRLTIAEITELVNNATPSTKAAVVEHIKRLVNPEDELSSLTTSYSSNESSSSENEKTPKKRKYDELEPEVLQTNNKKVRASLSLESKRGCKPRKIDGFTATEYIPSAKRYMYRCDDCNTSVDSRKIGTHQCMMQVVDAQNVINID